MARLALYLLGAPRLERDGAPVKVNRRKVIALLAYLAVAGQGPVGQPHSRESLVTLLSPELDASRARNELRRTLSVLNRLLGPDCLIVDRETVSLDPTAALWLDVDRFCRSLAACDAHDHPPNTPCPDCVPLLEGAVALYQDHFLAGFTLPASLAFEEWAFFQSEQLRNRLAGALERLVAWHSGQHAYEPTILFAQRWLALDPLHEPAQRQLMALYARAGRRAAALRQYRACLRALEEELGLPPSAETTALYQRIRADREVEVAAPTPPPRPSATPAPPAFLTEEAEAATAERPVFVARERELAQLSRHLEAALAGQGKVVLVTGGPGRGKTALMREFARRAMDRHPDLVVATGNCRAYTGIGDPYLPFREVLSMLTGDVESRWAAGAITRGHAQRLWAALPQAVQALLDHGSALIDIFLPGAALLSRAAAAARDGAGWLEHLQETLEREKLEPGGGSTHRPSKLDGAGELAKVLAQSQLFEGYTGTLRALAARCPLLLALDDLQWVDAASASLLFHLGLQLSDTGCRILILGAYRPTEVALGRQESIVGRQESVVGRHESVDGRPARHPLEKVLAEFKRGFGDVWVDLTRADELEGMRFVEAYLDTEPNRLGDDFRGALFHNTGGHPLFTVELLHAMQERGDLVRDANGRWIEGPALDWDRMPARVEAVIEDRVGRLAEDLRDVLSVASVEGEEFTAQVVARVLDIPEREILRALSRELKIRHRLVRELGEVQIDSRFLSRYRFAHALFQGYLYNALSAGERRLLHGEVAEVLEALHQGQAERIAAQLARHYAEAGEGEKAVEYSLWAGDQARVAYAHQEAIGHYLRALTFLKEADESERAARTLMKLGLTHHNAFQFRQARQALDKGFALWQRAAATSPVIPLPPAPHALRLYYYEPRTLDPARAGDNICTATIDQLFSGLLELSPELEAVPDVAQSWDVSEGGCGYVFHLRDDVQWSDGTPLTARDFEYAWKRALDPATGSPTASLLYDVKGASAFHQGETADPDGVGVRALDPVTLLVELEGPTSYFPLLLTTNVTYPVPRHVVEAHGEAWIEAQNIVTNGPFRLQAWRRRQSMFLVRNPDYHGRFTGNVQRVEMYILSDLSAGLKMYEADGLDAMNIGGIVASEMDLVRQRHAGEYVSVPLLDTWYVRLDVTRPPFDDPRVRRAFAMAMDREKLADVVQRGYLFPATGGFVPPWMPGHSPDIGLPYDPERARQLLAEAGYPGGRGFPTVILLAGASPSLRESLEFRTTQWRENLGVEVTCEVVKSGRYDDMLEKGLPHIIVAAWGADYPDPDNFLRVAVHHVTRWRNQTYERLLHEAMGMMNQQERLRLYAQADRILVEEAAIIPATHSRSHRLVKPWVSKYPASAMMEVSAKDVIIEPH